MSANNDKLVRLAEMLLLKYNLTAEDNLLSEVKNEISKIYQKFMLEYFGSQVAQLKEVYKLPYLDEIQTVFSLLVSKIDSLDVVQIINTGNQIITFIDNARKELNNFIKTNKEDPSFTAFHMRKKIAATVEKSLEAIQFLLRRQLQKISSDVPIQTDRRRMEQTAKQQEVFILTYGDLYGIKDGLEDWGKLRHQDPELANELMTAFLGLRRAHRDYQSSSEYDAKNPRNLVKEKLFLLSKVKPDLLNKVKEFFGERL